MTEEVDEFLAHFGVKGMHWGVVREEDPSTGRVKADKAAVKTEKAAATQVKREGRAQKFDLKAADLQKQIDGLNKLEFSNNLIGRTKTKSRDADVRDLTKEKERALKDADLKRQGKLSSTQKKVIIGASVVTALIATKVVYDNAQSGNFNRLSMKGKAFVRGDGALKFARNEKFADKNLSPDLVHSLIVKDINPNYGAPGTKVNCRRATFAYEMRRRGFDVAATKTTNASGQNGLGLLNATTEGAKFNTSKVNVAKTFVKEGLTKSSNAAASTPYTDITTAYSGGAKNKILGKVLDKKTIVSSEHIFSSLSSQPDGSRGELVVNWLGGGAHSMAYEIFKGKPVVFDPQSGEIFKDLDGIKSGIGFVQAAGFTRLDDIPLNTDFISKWVKNVKRT